VQKTLGIRLDAQRDFAQLKARKTKWVKTRSMTSRAPRDFYSIMQNNERNSNEDTSDNRASKFFR
jgi:hypothetical protein